MAIFKEITPADVNRVGSFLNQVVDIVQSDISGSGISGTSTRKCYEQFISQSATSGLFQTVYDQPADLQTANAVADFSVGLFYSGTVVQAAKTGETSTGLLLFSSQTLMVREKIDTYKNYAATLLGNADSAFYAPYTSTDAANKIENALFIDFKRLFKRDFLKKETFAMKFYTSASNTSGNPVANNLSITSEQGPVIVTDAGANTIDATVFGGRYGNLVNATNTAETLGLLFYDAGTAILDFGKIVSGTQELRGHISSVNGTRVFTGSFNQLLISGSVDDVVNHVCSTRFSSGSLTGITFQNVTEINSMTVACRASANEFNYSSNPTYTDSQNRIVVIEAGQEQYQTAFSFITSVGLYDANNNLLAVAKMSRPIQKSLEKDLLIKVRLDF